MDMPGFSQVWRLPYRDSACWVGEAAENAASSGDRDHRPGRALCRVSSGPICTLHCWRALPAPLTSALLNSRPSRAQLRHSSGLQPNTRRLDHGPPVRPDPAGPRELTVPNSTPYPQSVPFRSQCLEPHCLRQQQGLELAGINKDTPDPPGRASGGVLKMAAPTVAFDLKPAQWPWATRS